MTKPVKPAMPKEHPKPFQSSLWPHLETIREMRRARKMWTEIAEHLKTKGVTVSYRTVRNFFLRTRSPKRRIPAGFEEALGVVPKERAAVPSGPAQPATERPDYEPFEEPKDGLTEFQRARRKRLQQQTASSETPDYEVPDDAADNPAPNTRRKLEQLRKQKKPDPL
jgi:IS5 family transposase